MRSTLQTFAPVPRPGSTKCVSGTSTGQQISLVFRIPRQVNRFLSVSDTSPGQNILSVLDLNLKSKLRMAVAKYGYEENLL